MTDEDGRNKSDGYLRQRRLIWTASPLKSSFAEPFRSGPNPAVVLLMEKTASALSQLTGRVGGFEFNSGDVDLHLPIDTTLGIVDIA